MSGDRVVAPDNRRVFEHIVGRALSLAIALTLTPALAGETGQGMNPEITLPGPDARAIAVAFAEFQKLAVAIEHYQVIVATHADTFEVVFLPNAPAGRSVRGGETPAGKEMHCWISRQDFGLLRTTFAR